MISSTRFQESGRKWRDTTAIHLLAAPESESSPQAGFTRYSEPRFEVMMMRPCLRNRRCGLTSVSLPSSSIWSSA